MDRTNLQEVSFFLEIMNGALSVTTLLEFRKLQLFAECLATTLKQRDLDVVLFMVIRSV